MKYFVIHTQKGTPTLKEFASEKTRDTFIRDFLLANQLSEDTIDYIGEGRIARAEEYFGGLGEESKIAECSENSPVTDPHPELPACIVKNRKEFGDFLKSEGAYENFCENFDFDIDLEEEIDDYLISTFIWHTSLQGYEYWENLNAKWKALCTQP